MDRPQLPLTNVRRALVAVGAVMLAAQLVTAVLVAPPTTGPGDSEPARLTLMWLGAIACSVVTVLLLVRQTDLPDVATASMIVSITTAGAFALSAALDVRGQGTDVDLTDALFLGVTGGALTAMLVWGLALGVARALRLPTTSGLDAEG